jgi:hypothetical protein
MTWLLFSPHFPEIIILDFIDEVGDSSFRLVEVMINNFKLLFRDVIIIN